MKKTSSKLFLAAAALGLAAASTVGSTYAWFTVNGSAQASGLSMEVASGSGIMIKKHSEPTYLADMNISNDFNNKKWEPCTPTAPNDLSSFKKLNIQDTISSNGYTYDNAVNTDNKLYFYTLDLDVRVSAGFNFKVYVSDISDTSSQDADCKAANVVRVGFRKYDKTGNNITETTVHTIQTRNYGSESNYALTKFKSVFGINDPAFTAETSNINDCINGEGSNYKTVTIAEGAEALNGYVTQRVAIIVWYEGNDYQCADDILSKRVTFKLNFVPVDA